MGKTTNKNNVIMYKTDDGKTKIYVDIDFENKTAWLSQEKISELFDRDRSVITKHLREIFKDELDEKSNVQKMHIANSDKPIKLYSLDAIIAVGYRVKSSRGTQFRKWATQILNEYIHKGFAMNDELLKQAGGGNYFKELLQRIRDIRSSEKVFYRQILDIYATSVDYDSKSEMTQKFFKLVQNKMHYAVHGKTAAELILSRANSELPFMGLTAFDGGKPKREDAIIAKNYLSKEEIENLNLIVSIYFDFAELQAKSQKPMYMKDWIIKLDSFLKASDKNILNDAGKVSHEFAVKHAKNEYSKYKEKTKDELTQVEKDFLDAIHETYKLLINKKIKK